MGFPSWTRVLDESDWVFLKRFLLQSGSLKALAKDYAISYPTVRRRLDQLIAKVEAEEEASGQDAFHRELRMAVAEGKVDSGTARRLLNRHRESMKSGPDPGPEDA